MSHKLAAMKYILVPGGAGYVGSHTVVEILNTGEYVAVVVDNLYNASKECIKRIEKLTGKEVIMVDLNIDVEMSRNPSIYLSLSIYIYTYSNTGMILI